MWRTNERTNERMDEWMIKPNSRRWWKKYIQMNEKYKGETEPYEMQKDETRTKKFNLSCSIIEVTNHDSSALFFIFRFISFGTRYSVLDYHSLFSCLEMLLLSHLFYISKNWMWMKALFVATVILVHLILFGTNQWSQKPQLK